MNQNNFFLVLGPESAGNHVTTEILIQMGCFGDLGNEKLDPFVNGQVNLKDVVGEKRNVVLRRSVPYGYEWVDVEKLRYKVEGENYQLKTIIVVRDWMANISSNHYYRTNTLQESVDMIGHVWKWIGSKLASLDPFYFFNTSLLFKNCEATVKGLEWFTGLKFSRNDVFILKDSDLKHHEAFNKFSFIKMAEMDLIEFKETLQEFKGTLE